MLVARSRAQRVSGHAREKSFAITSVLRFVMSEKNTKTSVGVRISQRQSAFEHIGEAALKLFRDIRSLLGITGETAAAICGAARNPRKIRWRENFYYF